MRHLVRPVCRAALGLVLLFLLVEWCAWQSEIRALHQPLPVTPMMAPWTVILIGLLTIAVLGLFRPERWARVLAKVLGILILAVVTAFGFESLAGYAPMLLGPFRFREAVLRAGWLHGGRPSAYVLATTASYAVAIISYGRKRRAGLWLPQVATISGFLCPMMALIGYAYQATALRANVMLPPAWMALPSAVGLLLVGLALFGLYQHRGVFSLFCSEAFGGKLIRRFFALVVFVPIILGWFFYHGQTLSGPKLEWCATLTALLLSVSYTGLLFWIGHLADQHEKAMVASAKERDRLIAELKDSVDEITQLRSQLITICAWSSRIKNHGRWMTLEEFLDKQLHLKISHGISDAALSELLTTVERDAWERQEAARGDVDD